MHREAKKKYNTHLPSSKNLTAIANWIAHMLAPITLTAATTTFTVSFCRSFISQHLLSALQRCLRNGCATDDSGKFMFTTLQV